MPRSIWKGSISFGLVQIPVALYSAESRSDLHFKMLDQRNMAPVGYERVNKVSGEPVPHEEIVKGWEYDKGEYVVVTDEDLAAANVEATQTIDICDFVDGEAIDLVYYDKPYYLGPTKKGWKPYALLRETLRRTGKVGIAKVVIRTRQYLAAVVVRGEHLVLELMRYAHELREPEEIDVPGEALDELGVTDREVKMAEQLVEQLVAPWEPEKYRDEYRDDLMALIDQKVKSGAVEAVAHPAYEREEAEVIDLMSLLKKSVARAASGDRASQADAGRAEAAKEARAAAREGEEEAPAKKKAGKAPKKAKG